MAEPGNRLRPAMFKLFHSIFGAVAGASQVYPESLVTEAIERALDGTDPRIRLLPGYAKKLREPVTHAIGHVIQLVDALAPPVLASAQGRDSSPTLSLFFYSTTRMADILGKDQALREFFRSHPDYTGTVTALLVATREEKQTFGYALVDDKPMSDVAQTLVSFSHPLLHDVCIDEAALRPKLKRRAFDYLLTMALARITERQSERSTLSQRRAVMRAKLALQQKSSAFASREDESLVDLQTKYDAVEKQLQELGADDTVLDSNLATLIEVLQTAEKYLWITNVVLHIDQRNVLHDRDGEGVAAVSMQDLYDGDGRQTSLLLLSIPSP